MGKLRTFLVSAAIGVSPLGGSVAGSGKIKIDEPAKKTAVAKDTFSRFREAEKHAFPLLVFFEGCSLEAYKDCNGIPTIGIGNITFPDGRKVTIKDKLKNSGADVIVIQVSDNYRGKQTREVFQKNYEQMIRDLRGDGNPIIVCVTNWGGPTKLTQMIREAAAANNVLFADIATPGALPENRAGSEGHFTNGGVNWHPGDRGMAVIADTIYAAIESALKQKLAR